MGVRLIRYGVGNVASGTGGSGTEDHNELLNRDMFDQHPIYAITGLQEAIDNIYEIIEASNSIQGTIDTKTLKLEYNANTKLITGDVQVANVDDNAIEIRKTGLFVDKYCDIETQDTLTIDLDTKDDLLNLQEIFNSGIRFSHNNTWNNISVPSDINQWYYNSVVDSYIQPINTSTFNGCVSSSDFKYRTYELKARFYSTNSNDNLNGLVLGYVTDDTLKPHTITALVWKNNTNSTSSFEIWYDYCLPDAELIYKIDSFPINHNSFNGWNQMPFGISAYVTKKGSKFEVTISDWNNTILNPASTYSFDVRDYSWGNLFKEEVQFGFCNKSQPSSYFTDFNIKGRCPLKANVIISNNEDNCLEIKEDGLYAKKSSGSANVIKVEQIKHGFRLGDVLYCKSNGTYDKALCEDTPRLEALGVVSKITTDDIFEIMLSGYFETDIYNTTFSNGDVLYLAEKEYEKGTLIKDPIRFTKPIATKIDGGILINIQRGNEYNKLTNDYTHYTDQEILDAIDDIWEVI